MSGHGERLSRKQDEAVLALLSCTTIKTAAEQVGVNEKTLRGWLKLPAFLAAYRTARRQAVEAAIGQLQRASSRAVRALVRNLQAARSADQIRAAVAILSHSLQAVELMDLDERLRVLEEGQKQPPGAKDKRG